MPFVGEAITVDPMEASTPVYEGCCKGVDACDITKGVCSFG